MLCQIDNAVGWLVLPVVVINPFVLGTALWANPDTLTLFCTTISVAVLSRSTSYKAVLLASFIFSLAVLTRQSILPIGVFFAAFLLHTHKTNFSNAFLKVTAFSLLPFASVAFLYFSWGGLVPEKFSHHSKVGLDPLTQTATYFGLLLLPTFIYHLSLRITTKLHLIYFFIFIAIGMLASYYNFFELSQRSGVMARISRINHFGSAAIFLFSASFMYAIYLALKKNWIIALSLIFFIVPTLVYGDVYYQKYIEPYIALFAIFFFYSVDKISPKKLFSIWISIIYLGFFIASFLMYS